MRWRAFICILGGLVVSLIVRSGGAAVIAAADVPITDDAVWTGGGADDRWSNPANWAGAQLPTLAHRVIKDPTFDWAQPLPHGRQTTVTIDAAAQAGEWTLNHFSVPPWFPFRQIRVVAGADLQVGTETMDLPSMSTRSYVQAGGVHRVNAFTLGGGEYHLEGGSLIAGTITSTPDGGMLALVGGRAEVGRLVVTTFPTYGPGVFKVGGTADLHVTEELLLQSPATFLQPRMDLSRPIRMVGADFKSQFRFGLWDPQSTREDTFEDMHLVFEGGLADVALVEVSSFDAGGIAAGWSGNANIGTIEIGGDQPAHVRLMDEFASWSAENPTADAQYVDTLRLSSGSVLDLNGLKLYCRVIDNQGGTFLNGQPALVPEPATLAGWLLVAAAVTRRRQRRRR